MKPNELLALLAQDPPGLILGYVVGQNRDKPVCKIRFGAGDNIDRCTAWLKGKFCQWTGLEEKQLTVTQDLFNFTVEIKGQ